MVSPVIQVQPSRTSSVAGAEFMGPSSEPTLLCPRFLPGMWNRELPDDGESLVKSPRRENMPFFLGLASSSSSPTSSNCSSSIAAGCLSRPVCTAEVDVMREKRESSEVREGIVSL